MIQPRSKLTRSILLISLILLLLFKSSYYLELKDQHAPIVYERIPIDKGDTFVMRWIHSVELEPWEEIFVIDDHYEIILDSTRFKAFGAGVPDSAGKRVETKDGFIAFKEINQKMPYLVYGISDIAQHTLFVNGKTYELYKTIPIDHGVEFTVKKRSTLDILLSLI